MHNCTYAEGTNMKQCATCAEPWTGKGTKCNSCRSRDRRSKSREDIIYNQKTGLLKVTTKGLQDIFDGKADDLLEELTMGPIRIASTPAEVAAIIPTPQKTMLKCGHPEVRGGMCHAKGCTNSVYAK